MESSCKFREKLAMGHTYTNLLHHIIFSTKDRVPYLRHVYRDDVFAYIGGIANGIDVLPMIIGGHDDHVHMLVKLRASASIADVVGKLKANSCRWIHEQNRLSRRFAWQDGYGAFSVSESGV